MSTSVIIPNYNHADLLTEAVQSILNQTKLPQEILIIDDCSTDNSLKVIQQLSKKTPLIRWIRNEKNLGVAESTNRGFEEAIGEYVTPLASDDLLFPNFLSRTTKELDKHPEIGICSGKIAEFSGQKPPYQFLTVETDIGEHLRILSPLELKEVFKKSTYFIYSNGTIFRRKAALKHGKYRVGIANLCDWYLNNCVALDQGLIFIPEVFSALRVSRESYSAQIKKDKKYRERAYFNLMNLIEKGDPHFKKQIKESGALGQLGIRMVYYLFKHTKYWGYFLRAALSKGRFLRAKMQR